MEVKEIYANSILIPSKLPDTDYVVNPYTGCGFGCVYCYASFMGRFVNKAITDWGKYVYIKINAPQLLSQEVTRLKQKGRGKTILFSSVTDPYQGLEAKYKITRQCLQVLLQNHFQGTLSILTKSHLVLRDTDLLKQFPQTEIGLTITTTDDKIARFFETKAPPVSKRLETLKQLNQTGFKTYAFVGPLLPHFVTKPQKLDQLFAAIAQSGTTDIYVEHINLRPYIFNRLKQALPTLKPPILNYFHQAKTNKYKTQLNQLIHHLIKKHHLTLRTHQVISHTP